jgi:predicted lipoprotein with Yx(FWY)xxD motif
MARSNRARTGGRTLAAILAGALGAMCALFVGLAVAKSFTLRVQANAPVTNINTGAMKHESIVVNSKRLAVYALSGETAHHLLCTKANGCFDIWPPVTVASAKKLSKAPGIKGKLGTLKRGRQLQATLGGHPLYTYSGDTPGAGSAYEGAKSFGGTWHVIAASASSKASSTNTMTMTTSTTTTTQTYTQPY